MSSDGGMYMVVNGVAIRKNDYEKYMYVKSLAKYDQPPSYSEIYDDVTPPKKCKRHHKKVKCPEGNK